MISVPLIHAQFVPPRVKSYIKRAHLKSIGNSILSHKVTTVVAPAGYGKSVWVSSLLEETDWPPTPWLSLDCHDSEPAFLLYHLIHSIKRVAPGFGIEALRTMNSLEDISKDWQIAASVILEELPVDGEIVIVLDDLYLIDHSPIIRDILQYLIRWLPLKTHIILISRSYPPLNLYREELRGELLKIGSSHLTLSLEETREILMHLDMQPDDKEIENIYKATEGWAVALRLLGMYLKQSNKDVKKTLKALTNKDTNLYTYLSSELLQYLSDDLRDFLLDASLLPYLEPDLCNRVLNCKDSDARINLLHAHGVLSHTEGDTITWRLHHLMKEFLEEKALQLRSKDEITSIRLGAAAFLEDKGDIDRAIEQALACSSYDTAATLIMAHGDRYFLQSGRLDALKSWLSLLPIEVVSNNYCLLYFKGMSLLHINQEEALENLSWAADLAGKSGDVKFQINSLFATIVVYTFVNNVEKIKEIADGIPIAAGILKDSWSRGMMLVATLTRAAWEDNLKEGSRLCWLAGKNKMEPLTRTTYLAFSCMIQFRLGNLTVAEELIEKLLSDPFVQENECWTAEGYTIYTVICELTGNFEKLEEITKELFRLGKKYNSQHQLGFAHRSQGQIHQNRGDCDKAIREYELSHRAFIRCNNIFYSNLIRLELILLRITAREVSVDYIKETNDILEELKGLQGGRGLDDYALSIAGIIAMKLGYLDLAQQHLEMVSKRSEEKGARHVLAGTQLLLARLTLLRGEDKIADDYLRAALGASEAEKWEYFWEWHSETIYTLCRRALLRGIYPKWAVHLLKRWFPRRTSQEACGLLIYPDENVQISTFQLLQDIAEKDKSPLIHVNFLGGFSVFVNGIRIDSSHWKTQKVESLAKFLLANRRNHSKEIIIENLWPESDPKLGDASLRMALTHLRKTIGINDYLGDSVILRRGMLYINPKIKVYTDYELFITTVQKALKAADVYPLANLELLEEAIELYRGDFLPDNLYDDWTTSLRQKLQQQYLQALFKLIEVYSSQDKPALAIKACQRYLATEPTDEGVVKRTMVLLWKSGQKQQALALYQELVEILKREYAVAPEDDTKSLYEKIRGNQSLVK